MSIGLGLSIPPSREEERFLVRFETDHGNIDAPVSLVALARDSFNPDSLGSPTLNEAEGWEFDVVHRAILDTEQPRSIPVLDVPSGFVARQMGVQRGQVAFAPRFTYQDTKYLLTLKNKEFGLHKSSLR